MNENMPVGYIKPPDNMLTDRQAAAAKRLIDLGADPKDIAELLQAEYIELPKVTA